MMTLARQGKRVVATAYKKLPKDTTEIEHGLLDKELIFVGLVGIIDPLKEEIIDAILQARREVLK